MKYMRPVFVETSGEYNHKLFFMHLQSNAEFFRSHRKTPTKVKS